MVIVAQGIYIHLEVGIAAAAHIRRRMKIRRNVCCALISQNAVSFHFTSKQIQPFGFAEQCGCEDGDSVCSRNIESLSIFLGLFNNAIRNEALLSGEVATAAAYLPLLHAGLDADQYFLSSN